MENGKKEEREREREREDTDSVHSGSIEMSPATKIAATTTTSNSTNEGTISSKTVRRTKLKGKAAMEIRRPGTQRDDPTTGTRIDTATRTTT